MESRIRAWERLPVTVSSRCGVREIVMAFDNDAETNPLVASGLKRDANVLDRRLHHRPRKLVAGMLMMIDRRVSVEHADVFAENGCLKVENAELRTKLACQVAAVATACDYQVSG